MLRFWAPIGFVGRVVGSFDTIYKAVIDRNFQVDMGVEELTNQILE